MKFKWERDVHPYKEDINLYDIEDGTERLIAWIRPASGNAPLVWGAIHHKNAEWNYFTSLREAMRHLRLESIMYRMTRGQDEAD